MKHVKIFLHANSELCSSHVGLFQANFAFFVNFLNFWIDNFKFFRRPRHHFAHPDYKGGWPPWNLSISMIIYRFLYWVCILNFGVWSVFEFLAYEGMSGTTNPAVVDLSPYGFVFWELALQSLILDEFLSFLFFCTPGFYGGLTPP